MCVKSSAHTRSAIPWPSAAATRQETASVALYRQPRAAVISVGVPSAFFPGFAVEDVRTSDTTIHTVRKGDGPPILLLHGFPQTHVTWHFVAPRLAEHFTVIATDLRGYGDSGRPADGERHEGYSFRAMAKDQIEVMRHFGFDTFYVGAHDRGARAAHRLCLDHPDAVRKVCVMDIVPTLTMYGHTNKEFATKYMWWFFLIQNQPLPEHMIGCDPLFFLDQIFAILNKTPGAITPEALAEYRRCFVRPDTIHAMCEDYRASAEIDLEMDQADHTAGRKIQVPVRALWGSKGTVGGLWDIVNVWREYASNDVTGRALNAGHHLPEEQPDEVLAELQRFFSE
jgi:haloacetate dehalogenase